MNYRHIIFLLLAMFLTFSACAMSQENTQETSYNSKEYIVQFRQGTGKDKIATVLHSYHISNYSYLTTRKSKGYIVLIKIDQESGELGSLKQESCVKHIDPNYQRSIDTKD